MCVSPPNTYLPKWKVCAGTAQVWHVHPANAAAMTPVAKEGELKGSVKSAPEAIAKMLTAYGIDSNNKQLCVVLDYLK